MKRKKINSPKPFMPGAVTIELCEQVNILDPERKVCCIGIVLPINARTNGRRPGNIEGLPGWINVPFVEWLEVRLKRDVTIVSIEKRNLYESFNKRLLDYYEICYQRSFIAASIASKYFKGVDYSIRN